MKYVLRKAFEKEIGSLNEELLWRLRKHSKLEKLPHSDFLKKPIWKKKIEDIFEQLFIEKNENTELRELAVGGHEDYQR